MEFEKPYLDAEKESFESLSDEEREHKIAEAGTMEAAIQQHGLEQALKSMDVPEAGLTPEEQERFDKMLAGARNVIESFSIKRSQDGKKGENLTIITDPGAEELLINALYQAGNEAAGGDCRVLISEKPAGPAQPFGNDVGERISNTDCLLLVTSFSRSHSAEVKNALQPDDLPGNLGDLRRAQRGVDYPGSIRVISMTQTRPELLTEGAVQENAAELRERLNRLTEAMKDCESVSVSSKEGTHLEIGLNDTPVVDGKVDRPGIFSNFPFGEWSTTIDLNRTNGVLVIDGVSTLPVGELDEPITLTIENGVAIKIEGGDAATRLKNALESANNKWRGEHPDDHQTDAFRLAEFGVGVNSKAFRYTKSGERIAPPTSLEGEKGLGTIHIALGKNDIWGLKPGDPDYNPIAIHIDNVIMNPTVEAIKKGGKKLKIIENGQANF